MLDSCIHASPRHTGGPFPNAMPKKAASNQSLHRKHSAIVVDGPERAASRTILHTMGFKQKDFKKSQ